MSWKEGLSDFPFLSYIQWWNVVRGEALQTFYPTGSDLKKIHVSPDFSTFVTIDNIGILYILKRVSWGQCDLDHKNASLLTTKILWSIKEQVYMCPLQPPQSVKHEAFTGKHRSMHQLLKFSSGTKWLYCYD